jgi:hypothetical protein
MMATLGENQEIFAGHVAMLLVKAKQLGFGVRLGEVLRPLEMQEIYVRTGRSKTMNSQHIKKLAIDLNLIVNGKLATREQIKPLGEWWEALDPANRWGGSWRGLVESKKSRFIDAPHFERQG